jgi:hypothetical protein
LKNWVIFPATELAIAQKFEEPGHLSPQKPPAVFRPSRAHFCPVWAREILRQATVIEKLLHAPLRARPSIPLES